MNNGHSDGARSTIHTKTETLCIGDVYPQHSLVRLWSADCFLPR